MGTLSVGIIKSITSATPPAIQDSAGTEVGTFCRAWVNFNGTSGASPVIRASFNVSSMTRNAVGDYTVTLTNALADTNFAVVTCSEYTNSRGDSVGNHNVMAAGYAASTTTANIQTTSGTSYYDCATVSVSIFR